MLGMLEIAFGRHRIARGMGITRELETYFSAIWAAVPRIFTSGPFDS
jgi:hypothetical protein